MSVADQLKRVASRFHSGVTVVIARGADGTLAGFTASSFASVSMAPPLVLVCLDVGADSHSVFSTAESMTISILGTAQRDVAMRFAKRGENKFTGLSTADGEHTGLPLIDGAVAHLECRMHARHPAGDHTILVGEVLAGHSHHGEALLYGDRAFGHLTPIA